MIFNAGTLAAGWLSVALAASKDKDRPALCKSVCIDLYPEGVRLVSTDSYMLLRTWVPNAEAEADLTPEPDVDDAPIAQAIALDPYGRGKGFLAHVLRLAPDDAAAEPVHVRMDLGVVEPEAEEGQPTFAGMEARWCVIEHPDHERLKLRLHEGEYPEWRKLMLGFGAVATERISLNPEIVGRLARIAKFMPTAKLGWTFGGENAMARVEVIDSFPFIEGVVMPVRWDLERNAPWVDPAATDAESDA